MSDLFDEPDDATPLEPEERDGLLQSWVTTRADLNEAEQASIDKGAAWARRRRGRDMLSEEFVRTLHKRMFGEVWAWAGSYRRTGRNIGVDAYRIPAEVAQLLDDVRFWVEHGTYDPDEAAVRLHHRLVSIHPFPNGNGRNARMMADLLIQQLGRPPFAWGGADLADIGEKRRRYIDALQSANRHDIAPLLAFARSA
ncbi:MAG: mobile mystery protein B [Thalassobaculum sp.]|uniref:mobile mystery protein B n=1 Tax=Thalassobaculum sp. TaxID=2022740 RepID=UPI0032EC9923